MASPIHGRKGRLYVGVGGTSSDATPIVNLRSFSIESAVDTVETTVFGDVNKTYVSGLADASGSFAGFYDSASPQLYTAAADGAPRRFYLYPTVDSTSTYWSGTAIFDFSVEVAVDDAVKISGNWKAASAVTKTG